MGYPTRYYDIDPTAVGLAYGLGSMLQERYRIDAEHKQKAAIKKAKRKRALTIGLTAAAGGIAAPLVGPALGLAGAAASPGIAAGGTFIPGAAATSGILGTGGTVGLGGIMTGAAIGAQAGQAFAEGDYAGGLGAVARPIMAEQARRRAGEDRSAERAAILSDAMALDDHRTANDTTAALDRHSIANYGLPYGEALEAERQNYMDLAGAGPAAGSPIGVPGMEMSVPAMGPMEETNAPGPSSIPGMKRDWSPQQYRQLAKVEQRKSDTVDNPEWIASHTAEQRMAEMQAIERARSSIRVSTMPDPPKPMFVNEQGQSVPMQLGENVGKNGYTYLYDGKTIDKVAPTKASESAAPWKVHAQTEQEALEMMDEDLNLSIRQHKASGKWFRYNDGTGAWDEIKEGPGSKKDEDNVDDKIFSAALPKGPDADFSPNEIAQNYDKIATATQTINDRVSIKKALGEAIARPTMEPISLNDFEKLTREAVRVYGRDKIPDDVKLMLQQLDARLRPRGNSRLIQGPR